MQPMPPEKDPATLAAITQALLSHGFTAVACAFLSYVRILWEGKETSIKRQLLEALLGGLIVFLVGVGAEHFGLNGGWSYAVAGAIGVFGVEQVRQLGRRWAEKKVDA